MCLSCGCQMPDNDHGDERNITMADLAAAAAAAGLPAGEAASNIADYMRIQGTPAAGLNPVTTAMKRLHLSWNDLETVPLWVAEWLEETGE